MSKMIKTGPYNLVKGVLTAVNPAGIFLVLTDTDEDGSQVDVYVHPDLAKKLKMRTIDDI